MPRRLESRCPDAAPLLRVRDQTRPARPAQAAYDEHRLLPLPSAVDATTMPTKRRGCCAFARTPASPTMPMARPAARELMPTVRPAPRCAYPEYAEYVAASILPLIITAVMSP